MLTALVVYLAAALLGVALARTPLRRPRYWARWAALSLLLVGMFLAPAAVEQIWPSPPAAFGPAVFLLIVNGVIVLPVALFVAFLWQGRRMIDATGTAWWALLGLIPLAFIVVGALPSRPAAPISERSAVDVFR